MVQLSKLVPRLFSYGFLSKQSECIIYIGLMETDSPALLFDKILVLLCESITLKDSSVAVNWYFHWVTRFFSHVVLWQRLVDKKRKFWWQHKIKTFYVPRLSFHFSFRDSFVARRAREDGGENMPPGSCFTSTSWKPVLCWIKTPSRSMQHAVCCKSLIKTDWAGSCFSRHW